MRFVLRIKIIENNSGFLSGQIPFRTILISALFMMVIDLNYSFDNLINKL